MTKLDYIRDENGKLFVKSKKSGIPIIVILVDSLKQTSFKKSKYLYMSVTDVLDWYKKELAYGLKRTPPYPERDLQKYRDAIIACEKSLQLNGEA